MSMEEGSTIAARFMAKGLIDEDTKRYFTHFCHNSGMIRDELAQRAKEKYGFEAFNDELAKASDYYEEHFWN